MKAGGVIEGGLMIEKMFRELEFFCCDLIEGEKCDCRRTTWCSL